MIPRPVDQVGDDEPCALEIGFRVPERYNASEILFANLEAGRGDKIAVHCTAGDATYRELCEEAGRFGNAFKGLGLAAGDRIVFLLNDTAHYPAAFFGALRAGFVPILCNTLSNADLTRFYIEDAAARLVVLDAEHAHLLGQADGPAGPLQAAIVVNGHPSIDIGVDVHEWADVSSRWSADLECADTHRDDMAFWMYSSGSTGRPKGIVHLHHDMAYTMESYGRRILAIREDDVCFSVPKIFFAYGFGNSITFPFSVGASTVLHPGRPDPVSIARCVERSRPTLFFALPTVYNAILGNPRAAEADFASIRLCLSAAEVLSQDLYEEWRRRFDCEILEGLGSTEALHIYLSNTVERNRVGSAGRRVPGYQIKLTDPDGALVRPGEAGVMWVRGGSSAPAYWNRPDKTEQTMREGWIWTGDLLTEDADGFYTFCGRVDDLIKVSGQWVYPLEIELTLFEHAAIRECAVVGLEMPDRRMTLKAYVVLEDGHEAGPDLTSELQSYVKTKLLPYKYPRLIEYLDVLPKTGTDKIDRQALKSRPL